MTKSLQCLAQLTLRLPAPAQERNPRSMIVTLAEAPICECVDGVRRLTSECMDPDDPDLRAVYGRFCSDQTLYNETPQFTGA